MPFMFYQESGLLKYGITLQDYHLIANWAGNYIYVTGLNLVFLLLDWLS